jgi:glycosyltransferase involved in cell wall biosynthesis
MEPTPILSIITPVFDGENFICDCIDSVATQNCAGVEHIIVDGGSADRTAQILRKEAETHSHLRWISEPDRGQSDALNKGIAMAKAEYIGILNVDDFYEPGALCHVAQIVKGLPSSRFIVGGCHVLTTGDEILYIIHPTVLKFENIMVDDEKWPYPYNPSAYFYPKAIHDIIGPYNIEEHQGMDLEFILAAIQVIEPLYIDKVLGNWRYIPGTKTFNSLADGSLWRIKRRIYRAAWQRTPLKTKLGIVLLRFRHEPVRRLKAAYRKHRQRRAARRRRSGLSAHLGPPGSA